MPRSYPSHRLLSGLASVAVGLAILAGPQTALLAAESSFDQDVIGELPKAVRNVDDFMWFADPAESQQPGSTLPPWADLEAVGFAVQDGPNKTRQQLVKKRGKKNSAVANDASVRSGDTLVWAVANLASAVPKKLKSDVVFVVGAVGKNAVPYSIGAADSLTAGTSFVHLIGGYGSVEGAPWLTADDSTAGDAPGAVIDFGIPGSGAGGYDPKTHSIYTSFVLPEGTEHLTFSVYSTEGGGIQTDVLSGLGHTNRVPLMPSANSFDCAKVDAFPHREQDGTLTGQFEIMATLVEPLDRDMTLPSYAVAFDSLGAVPGSPLVEAPPESPPGSSVTYWQGTVDGGTVGLQMPGTAAWGLPSDGPPPAIADAFAGVRIEASGDQGGTIFGPESCGNFQAFEGCEFGGGAEFWDGLVASVDPLAGGATVTEFPVHVPGGVPFCVVVEEGADAPLMALGVSARPFTLAGHQFALESNACGTEPVDLATGGIISRCDDGSVTYSWLETGRDPVPGVDPGWGFRFELAVLPGEGTRLLGLDQAGSALPSGVYAYLPEQARALLAEAGWDRSDEGGYDFSGGPLGD